jgi:hypothetical protein
MIKEMKEREERKRKEKKKMKKEDIVRKLTSRKFWAALIGFVTAIMTAAGAPENEATQVASVIMAGGVLIAYILGEGMVDAARTDGVIDLTDIEDDAEN